MLHKILIRQKTLFFAGEKIQSYQKTMLLLTRKHGIIIFELIEFKENTSSQKIALWPIIIRFETRLFWVGTSPNSKTKKEKLVGSRFEIQTKIIYRQIQPFQAIPAIFIHFQPFKAISSHYRPFPASSSHSSRFQAFLAISNQSANPFFCILAISSRFSHVQPFLALSSHFQPFPCMSCPFQLFTAIPAISSNSEPVPAISRNYSHFQQFLAISSNF